MKSTSAEDSSAPTQGITRFKMDVTDSMTEIIKPCLADIPKGASSIIIIHRKTSKPMTPCDICKHRVFSELFNSAFIQLGEEEPLFYTNEFCSPKQDIEDWLNQKSSRHLVVTSNLALGFEHSIVINLAEVSTSSRSSGQLIIPRNARNHEFHLSYLALPIYNYMEEDNHDCRYLFLGGLDTPIDVIGT